MCIGVIDNVKIIVVQVQIKGRLIESSKDMQRLEDKVELIRVYGYREVENINIIVV